MRPLFPQFDVDYIAGVMSLRKPQKISLKRLADILEVEVTIHPVEYQSAKQEREQDLHYIVECFSAFQCLCQCSLLLIYIMQMYEKTTV